MLQYIDIYTIESYIIYDFQQYNNISVANNVENIQIIYKL